MLLLSAVKLNTVSYYLKSWAFLKRWWNLTNMSNQIVKVSDNRSIKNNKLHPIDSAIHLVNIIDPKKCWEIFHSSLAYLWKRRSYKTKRSGLMYFRSPVFSLYTFSRKHSYCTIFCQESSKWWDRCWQRRNNFNSKRCIFVARRRVSY